MADALKEVVEDITKDVNTFRTDKDWSLLGPSRLLMIYAYSSINAFT